jgi:hypothetical protein
VRSGAHYLNELAALGALGHEFHFTIRQGEQSVVLANADVFTRVKLGATLTNKDIARENFLAAEAFDAEAFRF